VPPALTCVDFVLQAIVPKPPPMVVIHQPLVPRGTSITYNRPPLRAAPSRGRPPAPMPRLVMRSPAPRLPPALRPTQPPPKTTPKMPEVHVDHSNQDYMVVRLRLANNKDQYLKVNVTGTCMRIPKIEPKSKFPLESLRYAFKSSRMAFTKLQNIREKITSKKLNNEVEQAETILGMLEQWKTLIGYVEDDLKSNLDIYKKQQEATDDLQMFEMSWDFDKRARDVFSEHYEVEIIDDDDDIVVDNNLKRKAEDEKGENNKKSKLENGEVHRPVIKPRDISSLMVAETPSTSKTVGNDKVVPNTHDKEAEVLHVEDDKNDEVEALNNAKESEVMDVEDDKNDSNEKENNDVQNDSEQGEDSKQGAPEIDGDSQSAQEPESQENVEERLIESDSDDVVEPESSEKEGRARESGVEVTEDLSDNEGNEEENAGDPLGGDEGDNNDKDDSGEVEHEEESGKRTDYEQENGEESAQKTDDERENEEESAKKTDDEQEIVEESSKTDDEQENVENNANKTAHELDILTETKSQLETKGSFDEIDQLMVESENPVNNEVNDGPRSEEEAKAMNDLMEDLDKELDLLSKPQEEQSAEDLDAEKTLLEEIDNEILEDSVETPATVAV